jgi:hypothetical protein
VGIPEEQDEQSGQRVGGGVDGVGGISLLSTMFVEGELVAPHRGSTL